MTWSGSTYLFTSPPTILFSSTMFWMSSPFSETLKAFLIRTFRFSAWFCPQLCWTRFLSSETAFLPQPCHCLFHFLAVVFISSWSLEVICIILLAFSLYKLHEHRYLSILLIAVSQCCTRDGINFHFHLVDGLKNKQSVFIEWTKHYSITLHPFFYLSNFSSRPLWWARSVSGQRHSSRLNQVPSARVQCLTSEGA